MVDGPSMMGQRDTAMAFRGSRNQRLIAPHHGGRRRHKGARLRPIAQGEGNTKPPPRLVKGRGAIACASGRHSAKKEILRQC